MLNLALLLCDFGLVVLIWMVQLVVYPSFHYLDSCTFKTWHNSYTRRISCIVLPLMVMQFVLHVATTYNATTVLGLVGCLLVLAVWLVTFLISVPCHKILASKGADPRLLSRLINSNWVRTASLSIVFVIDIIDLNW